MRVLDCRSGLAAMGVWVRRRVAKRETEGWKCDRKGVWAMLSVIGLGREVRCYEPIPTDSSFRRCCIPGLSFGRRRLAVSTEIWDWCFGSHVL